MRKYIQHIETQNHQESTAEDRRQFTLVESSLASFAIFNLKQVISNDCTTPGVQRLVQRSTFNRDLNALNLSIDTHAFIYADM